MATFLGPTEYATVGEGSPTMPGLYQRWQSAL